MPSRPRKTVKQRLRIFWKRELHPDEMRKATGNKSLYTQDSVKKETALGHEKIKYSSNSSGVLKVVHGVRFPGTFFESRYSVIYHYTPQGKLVSRRVSGIFGDRSAYFDPPGSFRKKKR